MQESFNVPSVRFPGIVHASYSGKPLTVEEAAEASELIVRVIVEDWLGDHSEFTTLYTARVVERYKGDCPDEIRIFQDGSSKHVFDSYPLYAAGDELVLFLQPSPDTENAYFNVQGWQTTFYVFEYRAETYLINTGFMFMLHPSENLHDVTSPELLEAFIKENPVWTEELNGIWEAYSLKLSEAQEKLWNS